MNIHRFFLFGLFIVMVSVNAENLSANSYLQTPEAGERIKAALKKGGIPLMQVEKLMLALSLSEQQREKVEPIFLTSIKKRAKALRKLKGVNGRPQEAIEDLKKIQRIQEEIR